MSHSLNTFLIHYGLIALFLLTLVKSIGIPIPIPADLVVLAAATGSASGKFVLWQAFAVLLIAMVVGGTIQFGLARGPGRNLLYRFGRHIGLTPARLDLAFHRVQNVGILGIAVAVVTPGIRTAAIPACGLTTIRARTFVVGLTLGTSCFLAVQFFFGYAGVKLIMKFWNGEPHAWLILALVVLVSVILWMVLWHRSRHVFGQVQRADGRVVMPTSARCPLCCLVRAGELLTGKEPRVRFRKPGSGHSGSPPVGRSLTTHAVSIETSPSETRRRPD